MPKKTKLTDEPKNVPEPIVPEPVKQTTQDSSQIFSQDGELVVDVYETGADFVVMAAIAGVQIKDLDISLEKDMMVIKGNRCDPHMVGDKRYFYQECYWGPFSRKVVLPENIDIDKADAQIDKGILTIKIPKNDGKEKVDVKVS